MPVHAVHRHLQFAPELLFGLVADVERYPEFVPWWVAAKVARSEGNVYHTKQAVGLPLMRQEFMSVTTLEPPGRITVTSDDKPFRHLRMVWTFAPGSAGGCDVNLEIDFEFLSARYGLLAGAISGEGVRRLVTAFEGRAQMMSQRGDGHGNHPCPHHHPAAAVGGGHHTAPGAAHLGGHAAEPTDDPAARLRHVGRPLAMVRPHALAAAVSAGL